MMNMFLLILFSSTLAHAELKVEPVICDDSCQSQLLRLDVDNNALQKMLTSKDVSSTLMPSLKNLMSTGTFSKQFESEYPMQPMGFPFNKEQCQKDKNAGISAYKSVDCEDGMLCSNPKVSEEVRSDLCFSLPCSMIKGSVGMSQCPPGGSAKPITISYPTPVKIQKIDMTPLNINVQGKNLKGCFKINDLETTLGIEIGFDQNTGIKYDNISMDNLSVKLDSAREICMSATIDLLAEHPISDVKIESQGGNFVSDAMINEASKKAGLRGLTGYSPAALEVFKLSVMPQLARHFRPTIEKAIASALSWTFERQLVTIMRKDGPQGIASIAVPSDSLISEMGVANMAVNKYVDLLQCAINKKVGLVIQPETPCLNEAFRFKKGSNLSVKDIPDPIKATELLKAELGRYDQLTSELTRLRLLEMENAFRGFGQEDYFKKNILPIADRISVDQKDSPLSQGINILTQLSDGGQHTKLGVSVPKICNQEKKSPHEGHSIANCPVQAYVDFDELNRLMKVMYDSGRLCHKGRGDYTPERGRDGKQVYASDGSPRGQGCLFVIEDDPNGMRCYLNGPPKISYDSGKQGYKIEIKTKDCYRGPVIAGQGKVGGDINFDVSFIPGFCGQDFCLDKGEANWNVTKGTERFALRETSFLNSMVKKTVDNKIRDVLKDSIRLPMNQGPLGALPMEPDGRIDKGEGYFGACLKYK
jgi:hypothetical protein